MKLYLGSRDYRPEGYLTVDIDPSHEPDILADVCDLSSVASGSAAEVCASHILEHIPWPLAYKALSEWARVLCPGGRLRLAVPDVGALAALIAEGRESWGAIGMIYGLGRAANPLEAHQFGYTRGMLVTLLKTLGFDEFSWWKHDLPDASNGWMAVGDFRCAISLNISATKRTVPFVEPSIVFDALRQRSGTLFAEAYAGCLARAQRGSALPEDDAALTQGLHMQLIEARMRILYLEEQLSALLESECGGMSQDTDVAGES
jgi:predicted SAM-dependent methyltransferase